MYKPIFRFVVGITAATGAAIAFGGAWFAYEMSSGPVRLGAMTGVLIEVLAPSIKPYQLDVADAQIIWDAQQREISLNLDNLVVRDETENTVLSLPSAALGFDLVEAVSGRVAPTYLIIPDIAVRVIRYEDGRFQTGIEGAEELAQDEPAKEGADPLQGLLGPLGGDGIGGWLRRVDLEHASVIYEDRKSGTTLRTISAELRLQREADGKIVLSAESVIDAGGGEAWPLSASVTRAPGAENLNAELKITNLTLAKLATRVEELAFLAPVDLPLSGTVKLSLGPDGLPIKAGVEASLAGGHVVWADGYDKPLKLDGGRISASVDVASQRVNINTLLVNRGLLRMGFRGHVLNSPNGIALKGFGGFEGLSIAALKEVWPKGAAAGARDWVHQNMLRGDISNARFTVDMPAGMIEGKKPMTAEALDLTFDLYGADAYYIRTMPPMRDAVAEARLTGTTFKIAIEEANIDTLKISDATFVIPDLAGQPTMGEVDLVLRGAMKDVLWLIDHQPLGYPTKLNLDPETFTGRAAARLRLSLPLVKDVLMEDVSLGVAVNIEDVDLPPLVNGFELTDAKLTLAITTRALEGKGTINVNGVEVAAQWNERFEDVPGATTPPSLFRGKVVTGPADRAALLQNLGVDFAPYLDGVVPLNVAVGLRQGKLDFIDLDMGLEEATLAAPELSHSFDVGAAARGKARLRLPDSGGLKVENFSITGPNFDATADFSLSADYQISNLTLKGDNMPGLAQKALLNIRTHAQGSTVELLATSAQIKGFGAAKPEQEPVDEEKKGLLISPIAMTVGVGAFTLMDKLTLQNLEATLLVDEADLIQKMAATATHPVSQKAVSIKMIEDRNSLATAREVRVVSDEAGPFLPLTGIVNEAEGGTLIAKVFLSDDDGPVTGEVLVKDVRLKDAPTLVNILNVGSLTGIADTFAARGILFNQITAPFSWNADGITLTNAVALGPSIGVHASGMVGLKADSLDLGGTITPAYSINSVLGKIPGIGEILVGGEGQGLFAARFSVKGNFVQPQVSVNALSALTPGFLRNLFGPAEPATPKAETPKVDPSMPGE